MKYYVIEIATGDSKISGRAVYEYSTETEAIATFHSKMGAAMKSSLYMSEMLMVIDDNGVVIAREKFERTSLSNEESKN